LRAWLKKLIDMKISRRAAIMNGKFESTSKNQDESNLNRPPCPLTKGKARLMPILRGAGLSKSFSRFARNSHSFACCTRAMVDGQISVHLASAFARDGRESRRAQVAIWRAIST
jgi:hypothetical protein